MTDTLFTISGEIEVELTQEFTVFRVRLPEGRAGQRQVKKLADACWERGLPLELPDTDEFDAVMLRAGFCRDRHPPAAGMVRWVPEDDDAADWEKRFHRQPRRSLARGH